MTELRADRPPRLVSACLYLGVLGAFQVFQVISVLTTWYSTDGQKQVRRFTDQLVDAGMGRGDAETVYRVYLGVLAMLAASVLVFAVYTAMGHAVSRIMLTITAPLMALVGMGESSVFALALIVVALYCVFQLWTPDVRRWFARLSGKQPPPAQPASPPIAPPTVGASSAGSPGAGDGPVPPAQTYLPPSPAITKDWVKIWSLVVLIASSIIAFGCGAFLLVYGFRRDELVRAEVDSPGNWAHLSEAEIRDSIHTLAVMSWTVLPLCLVAIGVSIALLVRGRHRRR
jgi:hypothetical protein